jgi:phosphatidylinositol alpha-1,6-mannosyltransferase
MVLRALPRIRARFPQAQYWIVGDSTGAPVSDAEDLRKLASELGLTEAVRFVGGAPFEDLPAYYSAADLFLTPNRQIGGDVEGFGITFLEAAACGKTSIAGRSGGAVDAVLHDETGWLVNGDDPDDVADGVLRVLSDDAMRSRLERGALQRAHSLTWDAAFANLQEALR